MLFRSCNNGAPSSSSTFTVVAGVLKKAAQAENGEEHDAGMTDASDEGEPGTTAGTKKKGVRAKTRFSTLKTGAVTKNKTENTGGNAVTATTTAAELAATAAALAAAANEGKAPQTPPGQPPAIEPNANMVLEEAAAGLHGNAGDGTDDI